MTEGVRAFLSVCITSLTSLPTVRQLISNDSTYEFKDSSMSGTPTYVCTNITWKEGDKIHFVSQPERTFKLNKLIPQHSVPVEAFLPLLPPDITPLVEPLPDSHFIKRVAYKASPLSVENAARLAAHTLAEVQLWETILRHHPHSNVMKYHGVVSDGERITGIVLERCKKTIGDARLEVDCERVLKEVRSAVDHLHSLGLIHVSCSQLDTIKVMLTEAPVRQCDINHHNVMIDSTGSALLIDFDSCKKEGGVRGGGTVGYTNEFNNSIASRELDYYALDRLEVYIRTGSFGVSHSPEEITERNAGEWWPEI